MTSPSTHQYTRFASDLHDIVRKCIVSGTLNEVAAGLAGALQRLGWSVDRLQLPLSILFGLKHPIYAGIILTWTSDAGSSAWLRPRDGQSLDNSRRALASSPYGPLLDKPDMMVRFHVGSVGWESYEVLRDLGAQGYVEYLALTAPLPDGATQVISIATRNPQGFGDTQVDGLRNVTPLIALMLHGLYQSSSALQIARTYLGPQTGMRVLEGAIGRGAVESITAALAFVDVRDFTKLSLELGADGIIPLLNETFDAIADSIEPLGGEILKFIGDAALIVFRRDTREGPACIQIVAHLLRAVQNVEQRTTAMGKTIDIGVGLHIGEVFYGNIGSRDRLDFTVMGNAVNLASRLEPLTKTFGVPIIISEDFANVCQETCMTPEMASEFLGASLRDCGKVTLKGIDHPITVWGVERRAAEHVEGAGD